MKVYTFDDEERSLTRTGILTEDGILSEWNIWLNGVTHYPLFRTFHSHECGNGVYQEVLFGKRHGLGTDSTRRLQSYWHETRVEVWRYGELLLADRLAQHGYSTCETRKGILAALLAQNEKKTRLLKSLVVG